MKQPTVAAIIPAYNAGRFVTRALASVRTQNYRVSEIIVVDDGSSDDTGEVVAGCGGDIRLVRQHNSGPSAARNRAAQEASSELIAFLDADDEWLPEAVGELVSAFERHRGLGLVTGDMSSVDEASNILQQSWFARHGLLNKVRGWNAQPVPRALAALMDTNFVSTSVVALPRGVFRGLGGFRTDLRYGEDLELWARIAARYPVVCLPKVLGLRRSHAHNTTKATEPLLKDLVRMSEIVRSWGGTALREQGVDGDELVAGARTDLGYWYFSEGRRAEARAALLAAARESANARALRYLALSCLPDSALVGLRRIKAALHG